MTSDSKGASPRSPAITSLKINQIEGREWWLWGFAVIVTLALTVGIIFLTFFDHDSGISAQYWTDLKDWVRALAALVLLFDLYTMYQHMQLQRVRRQLADRDELFQLITENAADMIAVVDSAGNRLYNSPAYSKVLGYSEEELSTSSAVDQIHPSDRERVLQAAAKARASGRGQRLEYRMRHKNGDWRILESTASPIQNGNGHPERLVIVTEAIVEEVKAWQSRPLEEMYPIVYLDAMMVKMRDNGHVQNQAIYVVLGVDREGQKEVLGLWVAQQEGAKFWLQVLTELKNRGVKDIFIACVDGLKGFPEAIETLYPHTEVQLCIVHLVRASLNYVPWKHRKSVAADLRRIYQAATAEEARQHLEERMLKWTAYPSVGQVWQRNWERITPFFHYPADIRKAIYTTNSVEALHRSLRKIIKTRGAFPNEESALKLIFLAIRQAAKKWTMPVNNWSQALNYFTVLWPERMTRPGRLA